MIKYIFYVHDTDYVDVLLTGNPAKDNDQKVQRVSSAIGYRISSCKRNMIHKDRCINLLITCRGKLLNADWLRQRAFFLNQEFQKWSETQRF